MLAAIGVLLLQAAASVQVTASVDRDHIAVGEETVYTLRATTQVGGTFRVELAQAAGLEVVDRTERSGLVVGATAGTREYVTEIRLKAVQVGTWPWTPVLVFVGSVSEVAPDVTITVGGSSSGDPAGTNPLLVGLIQRAPPPTSGSTATLGIVLSTNRVIQGEQLDVLTAAWFPRSLRARLRRPPTLKPPVLSGVWSVPQPAVPGVVTSRAIGDEVYDLFVSHQIVFPLTQGRLVIPPAVLEYGIPTTRRASGDEREVEAASDPVEVAVLPLPDQGKPAGYTGPVAKGLKVGYRLRTLPAKAGEPLPVEISVTGDGNLAFWAPPNIVWPPGSRAYLDHVSDQPRTVAGRLGGSKTFHFLLLADSVGSVALPPIEYPFYDPTSGYQEASGPGLVVAVLAPTSKGPIRPPPPLATPVDGWPELVGRLAHFDLWWLLAALPIVLGLVGRGGWRLRRPRAKSAARPEGLAALDRLIIGVVPEAERGRTDGIVHGFRLAGIDRATAVELARLKVECDRARFADRTEVAPSLGRRIEELLAGLPRNLRRGLGLALLLIGAGIGSDRASGQAAQSERPETQYRAGQPQLAAEGFTEQAERDPSRWQRWYDVAAAQYLAGQDAEAAAALETGFELAPRARMARALWTELEREHEPLHEVSKAGGLSVAEWRAVAMVAGILGGVALVLVLPIGLRVGLVLLTIAAAGWAFRRDQARTEAAAFTQAATTLRLSPHGLAPEQGGLAALSRVTILGHAGRWILVRDRHGTQGWMLRAGVAPIRRLD